METTGSRRWLVKISGWNPSQQQFDQLTSLLPPSERPSITRFVKVEDRKRALVSRLLQYSLVHEVLGIPFDEIIINRTVEGKPYLYLGDATGPWKYKFSNFNFNVSHSGDYVGIASEPICLVGLDIVSNDITKPEGTLDFIRNFRSYFTSLEWKNISNAGNPEEIVSDFCRYWCLKEAYVKALGVGVGYGLHRIEIHHVNWNDISIYIDGTESEEWKFWLLKLDNSHWASIAKGHPRSAVDSCRTLQHVHLEDECFSRLPFLGKAFTFRGVEELIQDSNRDP